MNKHIVNALKDYKFTFDKNNGYGFINDYEVNVFNNLMAVGPVFIFSTYLSQTKKNDFIIKMNDRKIPLVQTQAFDFGVMVTIGSMTAKSFEKKCNEVLPIILEILESIDAPKKDICPQSGEKLDELDSKTVILPGTKIKIRLSNKAVAVVNNNIDKSNEDYEIAPNNYLKGFAGIFIGALVGVVLTVIFALLGYITALAPLVSIFFGIFLYKKFGGKQNHVMIIMSFLTTLVILLSTLIIMYIIVADKGLAEAGLSYRGINAFFYCIQNIPEFKKLFYIDLALNSFVILLVEGLSIYRLIKMIKRPKNLE